MSSVSELRHALGASLDVLPKKQAVTEYSSDGNEKPMPKEPDSLVYTDSSTFLKVRIRSYNLVLIITVKFYFKSTIMINVLYRVILFRKK